MQDFLKDRPVLAPTDAKIITAAPPAADGPALSFARMARDAVAGAAPKPAAPAAVSKAPGAGAAPAAHTSQVKTVIENGKVTRLIVTCSCGKVTEIACLY